MTIWKARRHHNQTEINQHNVETLVVSGKNIYCLELKLDRCFAEVSVFGRQTSNLVIGCIASIEKSSSRQRIAVLTDCHLDLVSHRWILA